jgi:hypothetical protein
MGARPDSSGRTAGPVWEIQPIEGLDLTARAQRGGVELVDVLTRFAPAPAAKPFLTAISTLGTCAQEKQVLRWRVYISRADETADGLVAVVSKRQLTNPATALECAARTAVDSIGGGPGAEEPISLCAARGDYTTQTDTFWYFYGGTKQSVCNDFQLALQSTGGATEVVEGGPGGELSLFVGPQLPGAACTSASSSRGPTNMVTVLPPAAHGAEADLRYRFRLWRWAGARWQLVLVSDQKQLIAHANQPPTYYSYPAYEPFPELPSGSYRADIELYWRTLSANEWGGPIYENVRVYDLGGGQLSSTWCQV